MNLSKDLGLFIAGLFGRELIHEIIIHPAAVAVKKVLKRFERNHPLRAQYFIHYLENHSGSPRNCQIGACRQIG